MVWWIFSFFSPRRYSHLPGIPRNSLPWSAALMALAMKKRFLFESLGVLTLSVAKEEAIKPIRRALSSTQRAASCFSKMLSDPPVKCSGEPGPLVTFKRPCHVHHPSSRRRAHFGNHDLTGSHSPQSSSVTSVLTLLRTE